MKNRLAEFPKTPNLIDWYEKNAEKAVYKVNGHFHTPFSFSAFSEISQVFELAKKENVKILGINDFYVTDGYEDFYNLCEKNQCFPLFNIEFIALSKQQQVQDIRVNDPNNPGRTYFSGKGLDFPVSFDTDTQENLKKLRSESQRQVAEMISKLNAHLVDINADFTFSYEEIKNKFAKELVRERHIAKALRVKIHKQFDNPLQRAAFFEKLYSGKKPNADMSDEVAVENEIRANLLKKGGKAFVPEDPKAFLNVKQVCDIILNGGGIPCYPVLLDDKNGNYTDFEANKEKMLNELKAKNVFAVELIPGRNSLEALQDFVHFFYQNNFIVTFGTEHNTPKMQPLSVRCRGEAELTDELKQIAYNGACIIAAHQYLRAQNKEGYTDLTGKAKTDEYQEFVRLGKAVIEYFIK